MENEIKAKRELISIIVPCYNEEESLPLFYKEMCHVMQEMQEEADFELILVDDGSRDKTLRIFRDLAEKDSRVHYLSLSRNFGKESAIYAGLQRSRGDYVATMDADLQDPPTLLRQMFDDIRGEGDYDCIGTRRVTRKGEPPVRSFFARCFYKVINRISSTEFVDGVRDFRLMKRQMVNAVLSMAEYNRFSKGLFCWVGFHTKWLEYENVERVAGQTKWSFRALLLYSLEGIFSFSTVPLRIPLIFGLLFLLFSTGLLATQIVCSAIGTPLSSLWTLINVISFAAGVQLVALGVVCEYLARMYMEVKGRPIYVIREESYDSKDRRD